MLRFDRDARLDTVSTLLQVTKSSEATRGHQTEDNFSVFHHFFPPAKGHFNELGSKQTVIHLPVWAVCKTWKLQVDTLGGKGGKLDR